MVFCFCWWLQSLCRILGWYNGILWLSASSNNIVITRQAFHAVHLVQPLTSAEEICMCCWKCYDQFKGTESNSVGIMLTALLISIDYCRTRHKSSRLIGNIILILTFPCLGYQIDLTLELMPVTLFDLGLSETSMMPGISSQKSNTSTNVPITFDYK